MKNKNTLIIIAIVLFLILGIAFAYILNSNEVVAKAGTSDNADRPITALTYEGKNYKLKRNIDTLLLIGTDNYADDGTQGLFYNYDAADFLVVLIFDNEEKTVHAIQLNRDTMCDVQWLDVQGIPQGTVYEQIALAHSYGSGKEDSCENVVDTVEMLIFNAPIDNYIAFNMDVVGIINDGVGGVDVTVPVDMTADDPSWTKGAEIHLTGADALKFSRARMELGDENNENRLLRQKLYIEGFIVAARKAMEEDDTTGLRIYNQCSDNIITDYTLDNISQFINKLDNYTYTGMDTTNGENVLGEQFNEFYVDLHSLWMTVKDNFCR